LISDGLKFGNESNESVTKTKVALKSHSVTQAGDTLKRVAMLTNRGGSSRWAAGL